MKILNARRERSSITIRSLLWVVITCVVLFSVIGTVTFWQDRNARIAAAEEAVSRAEIQSRAALAQALWNYDTGALEAILGGLTRTGMVVYAEVLDEDDKRIAASGEAARRSTADHVWTVTLEAPHGSKAIGRLLIFGSHQRVTSELNRSGVRLVLAEFAKLLVLAAGLFLVIYWNITRHLVALSKEVERLRHDDGSHVIDLHRKTGHDEIDDLVSAINAFHADRSSERQGRQKAELMARERLDDLARMGRVAVVQSLSATLAHELNQPLGAISSNAEAAELLLDTVPTDGVALREILGDIREQAWRASETIANLRALVEKRNAAASLLDINELIADIGEIAKWGVKAAPITIGFDLAAQLPAVQGNRVQLQQVLQNLVNNARDAIAANPDGAGTITIHTALDDNGGVSVAVCDNGGGIPPHLAGAIFEPFYTTKAGGTGMGLWISHMIIEQHGGKLNGHNRAGGGACFSFSLPGAEPP